MTLLDEYVAERTRLVSHLRSLLLDDNEVVAAWIWGSLGDGSADELSDVDLWIILPEITSAKVPQSADDWFKELGPPLLRLEAPQNAPAGGAYLLTLFPTSAGPIQADWYWQPEVLARRPANVDVILERDKILLAVSDPVFAQVPREGSVSAGSAAGKLNYSWAMLPIVAKQVARGTVEKEPHLAQHVFGLISELANLSKAEVSSMPSQASWSDFGAQGRLDILSEYVVVLETLMLNLDLDQSKLPDRSIGDQVRKFIRLAEQKRAQVA